MSTHESAGLRGTFVYHVNDVQAIDMSMRNEQRQKLDRLIYIADCSRTGTFDAQTDHTVKNIPSLFA